MRARFIIENEIESPEGLRGSKVWVLDIEKI